MNTDTLLNRTELIQRMHKTPQKVAMAITGGGAEVIGELLRHGNGSATLLEAVVPYDQAAFARYIRGVPDKFCSPEAARDLAMAAFKRATELAPKDDPENLIGLGASCSLVKPDGEREGREHKAYIAVQTTMATTTYEFHINLLTAENWTREQEETFVSDRILEILAETMGLGPSQYTVHARPECVLAKPKYLEILTGKEKYLSFLTDNTLIDVYPQNRVIFPGSFFPIHEGHLQMAEKAAELTRMAVDFEVCVHNVDKPSMNFQSLQERLDTMQASLKGKSYAGLVLFTSTPTFVAKAETFPNSTFVVGWDTFKRIAEAKYYGGEEGLNRALARLRQLNTQFLVFHRIIDGKSSVHEPISGIPIELLAMSTICGEDILPPSNLSSSAIRELPLP
jgi:cytidyltransferase-like protein